MHLEISLSLPPCRSPAGAGGPIQAHSRGSRLRAALVTSVVMHCRMDLACARPGRCTAPGQASHQGFEERPTPGRPGSPCAGWRPPHAQLSDSGRWRPEALAGRRLQTSHPVRHLRSELFTVFWHLLQLASAPPGGARIQELQRLAPA